MARRHARLFRRRATRGSGRTRRRARRPITSRVLGRPRTRRANTSSRRRIRSHNAPDTKWGAPFPVPRSTEPLREAPVTTEESRSTISKARSPQESARHTTRSSRHTRTSSRHTRTPSPQTRNPAPVSAVAFHATALAARPIGRIWNEKVRRKEGPTTRLAETPTFELASRSPSPPNPPTSPLLPFS
jgi:hypothetical protein